MEAVFVDERGRLAARWSAPCSTRRRRAGRRIFDLAPGVLERVADTVTPQPRAGRGADARAPRLDDLAGATFVVVCVDVRDPGNAGAVIRVADAAGADAVVCCAGTVDPFNPKTVRASAGSVLHLPVVVAGDAAEVLDALAGHGMRVPGGGVPRGDAYTEVDLTSPLWPSSSATRRAGCPPELERPARRAG